MALSHTVAEKKMEHVIDRQGLLRGRPIKLPSGEKVKVLDIGIRRSKFASDDKAIIIVPNLDLSKSKIVNYAYGGKQGDNV